MPSTQEVLGRCQLCSCKCRHGHCMWTWVAAGRCLCPTHLGSAFPQVFSDLKLTTGFSPFLLYNMLGVWWIYQCRAGESRQKGEYQTVCGQREQDIRSVQGYAKKKTQAGNRGSLTRHHKGKPVCSETAQVMSPLSHPAAVCPCPWSGEAAIWLGRDSSKEVKGKTLAWVLGRMFVLELRILQVSAFDLRTMYTWDPVDGAHQQQRTYIPGPSGSSQRPWLRVHLFWVWMSDCSSPEDLNFCFHHRSVYLI